MIYIDPPYNTGNDFVYDDDFTEPLNDYLKRTGQIDGEGRPLTTNKKADGRFHSKWLSMMYPRLRLARELLRDDGVIFVSIDDNEVHHLRMMMNEVFGEENLVGVLCWKNKYGAGAKTKSFIEVHEYLLCYAKNELFNIQSGLTEEQMLEYDKKKDSKYVIRGGYVTQPLMTNSLDDRQNLQYNINYDGDIIKPRKQWVWAEDRLLAAIKNDEVVFKKNKNGDYSVRVKVYLRNEDGSIRKGKPLSSLNGPFNQEGTKEVANLIGDNIFSFPKPTSLLKYFFGFTLNNIEDAEGIYLDFFSGSATTAHAVLDLNREDCGNRKFILVQMPEATDEKSEAFKAGYKNIAEIGKERIRRVIKKIESERKEELPGLSDETREQDLGFNVFKLTSSNYKPWENYHGESIEKVEELFEEYEVPLVDNWKEVEDGLFTEILLLEGFPLDSIVTEKSAYTKNQIRQVKCSFHENRLLVCLDFKLASETIQSLELADGDTFVCLDMAIDDQAKSRLADKGMIKTI